MLNVITQRTTGIQIQPTIRGRGSSRSLPDPLRWPVHAGMRADTLNVLRGALIWQLTEARWARVAATVAWLSTALTAEDADGVRTAASDLEFLAPTRVAGIVDTLVVASPPCVREKINLLIQALGGSSGSPE
jgi:hypothetical protein